MKQVKSIFLVLILCAMCAGAGAQTVTVPDVEALPGETVAFMLNLTGGKANTYTALQFDVQFPATGFTTTGKYKVSELWENATATIGVVDDKGVATIPVASSEAISAADVEELLSVTFTVSSDVPVGEYDVTLKNLWLGYGTSSKDYLDDVNFKVKVVAAHTVVLDETSTTIPEAAEGVNVHVLRIINANEWSTICLPFSMSEEQVKTAFGNDVELADFRDYDYDDEAETIIVNFEDATEMEANHPYIIKVSSKVEDFTVDGVDIAPEDSPCVEYDNGLTGKKRKVFGRFSGTYVADFDFYNDAENYPLFLSGNKFYYATENTRHMKAFRAYFDFVDYLSEAENASSRIVMSFNSETTGISNIRGKKEDVRFDIYDLQGRKVLKPAKGLYIRNGRKEVIK